MIDPTTILSIGGAIGLVVLSIGAAVRLARGRVQRKTPTPRLEPEPDLRSAMMQRLETEIRRPYAVPPRVKK